tara:strand:+ start:83 stop:574 length:492 start_codon:yes stop_codon:yes gene_type:complete
MNIFYLDKDPREISEMQCDKHCVKMILESAQMLSTAHRILDGDEYADKHKLYKATHKNHPSTVWTRASSGNYNWHFDLFKSMLGEYTFRYGKLHKCMDLFRSLENWPTNIPRKEFTPPPQCMPEEYKCEDTVQAYRNYYMGEKSGFAKWKAREVPTWFRDATI